MSLTWTGNDVVFVDDFGIKGERYLLNSSVVLTEVTKSTNDKAEKKIQSSKTNYEVSKNTLHLYVISDCEIKLSRFHHQLLPISLLHFAR